MKIFENIGSKIKILAEILFWLMTSICIIVGIIDIANKFVLYGFMFIVFGPILSWINCFFIYGFGELIENSNKANSINATLHQIQNEIEHIKDKDQSKDDKKEIKETKPNSTENTKTEKIEQKIEVNELDQSNKEKTIKTFKDNYIVFSDDSTLNIYLLEKISLNDKTLSFNYMGRKEYSFKFKSYVGAEDAYKYIMSYVNKKDS